MAKAIVVPYGMLWMKQRLRQIDKSGAALARHLNIPKERVYEMYVGKRRLQQDEIGPVARFLEWTEAELVAHMEGRALNENKKRDDEILTQVVENRRQPVGDIPENPLLLYRTVLLDLHRGGAFMLYREPVDEVPRPFFLKYSKSAFAIKVLTDTMSPAYKRWDTVIIDPAGSVSTGEDHIFTSELDAAGGKSVIGCLQSSTGTHWIVHEYGTKKDQELARAEYPVAWPIVGRYNRR